MKTAVRKKVRKKRTPTKVAASYETIKNYNGKQYVGMQIGRSHKWYYDKGEWKDKKITPDWWEIRYAVQNEEPVKLQKDRVRRLVQVTIGTFWLTRKF